MPSRSTMKLLRNLSFAWLALTYMTFGPPSTVHAQGTCVWASCYGNSCVGDGCGAEDLCYNGCVIGRDCESACASCGSTWAGTTVMGCGDATLEDHGDGPRWYSYALCECS